MGKFDLVISSNAPVYLSEAVKVMQPGATILVTFSFGGRAFVKARKELEKFLVKNDLSLTALGSVSNGAYIVARKEL